MHQFFYDQKDYKIFKAKFKKVPKNNRIYSIKKIYQTTFTILCKYQYSRVQE